tara:strand:- start:20291 stop:20986 length:696 start_codon:yes stop_codon:yes gene_type:complete
MLTADDEFRRLWASEMSAPKIAAHYGEGVTPWQVHSAAKAAGLPPKGRGKKRDEVSIRRMWDAGVPVPEIARACDTSGGRVWELVRVRGWPKRAPRMKIADLELDVVLPLWFSPLKRADLAKALGVSSESVTEVKRHFKLPSRNGFHSGVDLDEKRCAWLAAKEDAQRAEEARAAAPSVPVVSGPPFWTRERDAQVFATCGRYAAIADAAAELGKPVRYVQARWHLLKVAA